MRKWRQSNGDLQDKSNLSSYIGDGAGAEHPRISGEIFFGFAQGAETAMMPSVAMLSEEIGNQRKFMFDKKKDSSEAMKAREKENWGKANPGDALKMELQDMAEEERIKNAANWHFVVLILVKVLIGNCFQLWLHSSFYALTYEYTGREAKIKVIVGMVASAIQALIRCRQAVKKLGGKGMGLALIILFTVGWSGAKVFFTYKCDSHLWNLSTGCVTILPTPASNGTSASPNVTRA
jgi:hypothetical protein